MRALAPFIGLCLLASACTKVQGTSKDALDKVETETATSWQKIREFLDLSSKPPVKEKSRVQPRYCYQAYHDVICYSKPLPGQENRLLAYQNTSGTGYTIAPPGAAKPKSLVKSSPKGSEAAAMPHAEGAKPAEIIDSFGTVPPKAVKPADVYGPMPEAPAAAAPKPLPATVPGKEVAAPRKLKEITFDPSELEPKNLVPERIQ